MVHISINVGLMLSDRTTTRVNIIQRQTNSQGDRKGTSPTVNGGYVRYHVIVEVYLHGRPALLRLS